MLAEIYPRFHARYTSLRLLGPYLDGFVSWLRSRGYPRLPIRLRIRATKHLEILLRRSKVRDLHNLTAAELLSYAPREAQKDVYRAALVRSLTPYLEEKGILASRPFTAAEQMAASYQSYLRNVRGFAPGTVLHHTRTVVELLAHLGYDQHQKCLRSLDQRNLENFIDIIGRRIGRESLQHTIAHLRSFVRFLTMRGVVQSNLGSRMDTPRVYRGERLPRALPWKTVRAFLRSIDRSTSLGRRDYAMFLLISTYGLRTSEVAHLTLDDVKWRTRRLHVSQNKVRSALILPLSDEVGTAILAYLKDGRPKLPCREIFLRARAPSGALKPTAVTEAFQARVHLSGLPIEYQGPHCLRHSLAVHLLRRGIPLKSIGDLLGHRSAESTCVYIRLNIDDLRDVAINLPDDARNEVRP